jgi:hypothetical protein
MKKTILFSAFAALFFASCEKNLNDYDPKAAPVFAAPPPIKAGEGYQVHIPVFPVAANSEREFYVRYEVGNKEDIYVNGLETIQRPGTHHLVLYGYGPKSIAQGLPPLGMLFDQNVANGKGNLRVTNGSPDSYIAFESPSGDFVYKLPDGYAYKIPANSSFNFNSHYFNKTNETRYGECFVNFRTVDKSKVKVLLENFTLDGNNFSLPPNKKTVFKKDTIFNKKTTFISMISHCHKRGENFVIKLKGGKNDGKIIYSNTDYAHAPYLNFPQPIVFQPGEGISWEVTYNNESNRTITYGVTSEDEMNFIFGFMHQD